MTFHGKKYRINNRFRFITFMALMMVITVFAATTMFGFNEADSLSTPSHVIVKVQPGDTLWDIADDYGPDDVDIRRVVYEICKLNDVNANSIHPGQTLIVPEYF